jgi:hypothetical protein
MPKERAPHPIAAGKSGQAGDDIDRVACPYRKSNPAILMVQSAQDRMADNASSCLGGA